MTKLPDFVRNSKYVIIQKPKDRQASYQTLEQDIRLLTSEIYRLIKLPYSSKRNREQIISFEKQIMYLEDLLAKYESAQKGME